jgi:hypothetical protein
MFVCGLQLLRLFFKMNNFRNRQIDVDLSSEDVSFDAKVNFLHRQPAEFWSEQFESLSRSDPLLVARLLNHKTDTFGRTLLHEKSIQYLFFVK